MDKDFEKSLTNGFKADTEYAIEQALQGQLSPYWQEYARRDIEDFRQHSNLPKAELSLWEQRLHEAIASCDQISDEAYSRKQIEDFGGELLYCFENGDHSTMIDVIKNGDVYTSYAYIDEDGSRGCLDSYCAHMKEDFLAWVDTLGLTEPLVPDSIPQDKLWYDTLEDALRNVLSILTHPDTYVI